MHVLTLLITGYLAHKTLDCWAQLPTSALMLPLPWALPLSKLPNLDFCYCDKPKFVQHSSSNAHLTYCKSILFAYVQSHLHFFLLAIYLYAFLFIFRFRVLLVSFRSQELIVCLWLRAKIILPSITSLFILLVMFVCCDFLARKIFKWLLAQYCHCTSPVKFILEGNKRVEPKF